MGSNLRPCLYVYTYSNIITNKTNDGAARCSVYIRSARFLLGQLQQ